MTCEGDLAANSGILNPLAPPIPETEIDEDGNDMEEESDQEDDRGVTAKRHAEVDAKREMAKKLQMPTAVQQLVAIIREGNDDLQDMPFSNQVLRCTTMSEDEAEERDDLSEVSV